MREIPQRSTLSNAIHGLSFQNLLDIWLAIFYKLLVF